MTKWDDPKCLFVFLITNRTSSAYHNPGSKDIPLGAPPPLISPKGPHHPAAPPTNLWNPASLVDTPADSRRKFNPPTPPTRPPPGLTRTDRPPMSWGEDASKRTSKSPERCPPLRGAGLQESWSRTEPDRALHSSYPRHHINNHHRPTAPPSAPTEQGLQYQTGPPSLIRERQTQAVDSMLIYDEVLQQHRRLLSKLDLEEKRRKEAREGGERGSDCELCLCLALMPANESSLFCFHQVITMTWMSHMMRAMKRM